MDSVLINKVLADVIQDNLSLIDQFSLEYIVEVLVDVKVLPTSSVNESLATLFVSTGVAETEAEAISTIAEITKKLLLDEEEQDSTSDEEEEDEVPLKLPLKAPSWLEKEVQWEDDTCRLTPEKVIALTYSEDPKVRKATLRKMCPCHVKSNIESVWKRILEMTHDPDANVRYQVMHNLCDGSPLCREDDVIRALEDMHNDPDKKIRRRVHQVLTHYRKTGKWNIL